MAEWCQSLRRLLARRPPPEAGQPEVDRRQAVFRERYQDFRQLLAANTRALGVMAELETALAEGRPWDMAMVSARCTALGVSVFRIIERLDRLAPGKYPALYNRFQDIQEQIERKLGGPRPSTQGPLVVWLEEADARSAGLVGGKMANLAEARRRLGLKTPLGFVATVSAAQLFLEQPGLRPEIQRLWQVHGGERIDQLFALSSALQQAVVRAPLPDVLAAALGEAHAELERRAGPGVRVALRSSAVGEDSADSSFAGLYTSKLNLAPDDLASAYKEVVASQYSPQAMYHRRRLGIQEMPVAVGCLVMVEAQAGGVVYSRTPLDIEDDLVRISSAWGLPKAVVDGTVPTDEFVVDRSEPPRIVERRLAVKKVRLDCRSGEGVRRTEVDPEAAGEPSLTDDQILALARLAVKLEEHFGLPQDIEFAVDRAGSPVILQCRPLRPAAQVGPSAPPTLAGRPPLVRGGLRVAPGAAAGSIFWVGKEVDALRFPDRAVLAVEHPQPRWAALLGRAAAVVAVTGGLAGHLASVAREYGIPALFDLADAARVLTNGQEVTVDADGLAVYPGRIEAILARTSEVPKTIKGSPVHQTLETVMRHISPLHLLDPDAPGFAPDNCRSWHDITRFCHEMAVQEMFAFGQARNLPERSQKQLYHQVPMQWWVINLDDGFHREVTGKYVHLEDIACQPMLALWEGITAVPWDGPPAPSGRGLASVLFKATTDPGLATPFRTQYANKNYFMISKNFMQLQSRFGFHFCAVEALASDRPGENYLLFSFKGGAADEARKNARVTFISALLRKYGFRAEVRGDTVTARLDGVDERAITDRLKLVGYLLMHTRQLDMIMLKSSVVRYYRTKMERDIEQVLGVSDGTDLGVC